MWAHMAGDERVAAHKFWRMSRDGTRLVSWGGDIFSFSIQFGRVAFNVDTPAEYQDLTDSYTRKAG